MRMDTRAAFSARNLVNEAPEEEIADILWQFGEEARGLRGRAQVCPACA